MGVVYFGRLVGPAGFSRPVAVKRMHPRLAADPSFVRMFVDEAHLTARIRHPNVVSVLDVIAQPGELLLVMEHIQGVSLSQLRHLAEGIPAAHCTAIAVAALAGLHAAHEARDEQGEPLGIVHQDVSPQNVLLGTDGVARVLDFGIAVASANSSAGEQTPLRGKLGYLAPEQLRGEAADRRADLYAMGVVLWEMLCGRRLLAPGARTVAEVLQASTQRHTAPSQFCEGLPPEVDAVCLRALSPNPDERFASAREMALVLGRALPPSSTIELGDYVERIAAEPLAHQKQQLAAIEAGTLLRIDVAGASAATAAAGMPGDATKTDLSLQLMLDAEAAGETAATMPMAQPPAEQQARSEDTGLTGTQLASAQPAATPPSARFGPRSALLLAGLAVAAGSVALAATNEQPLQLRPAFARQWLPPQVLRAAQDITPAVSASAATAGSAAPSPQHPPALTRPARQPRSTPVRPPPPRTAPPKARCNPPFEIDAHGDKRFKPGCF